MFLDCLCYFFIRINLAHQVGEAMLTSTGLSSLFTFQTLPLPMITRGCKHAAKDIVIFHI